jgi:hypothetical protein
MNFNKTQPCLWASCVVRFVYFWRDSHQWTRASSFTRFLDHTQWRTTVGRTPLDEWSIRRRDLYLSHNNHNRQTSMPPVELEPTISAGDRPQTYALDRAATGTGCVVRSTDIFWVNLLGRVEEKNASYIAYGTVSGSVVGNLYRHSYEDRAYCIAKSLLNAMELSRNSPYWKVTQKLRFNSVRLCTPIGQYVMLVFSCLGLEKAGRVCIGNLVLCCRLRFPREDVYVIVLI